MAPGGGGGTCRAIVYQLAASCVDENSTYTQLVEDVVLAVRRGLEAVHHVLVVIAAPDALQFDHHVTRKR